MSTTTTLDAAALFPDEVVTRSLVRDVSLPGGTFALLTLDNGFDHTRPNTFGPATLTALGEALDRLHERAEAGEIIGVGVTGKPFVFAVGADLTGVPKVTRRDQALAIGRLGHETFARLSAMPVPTFAFTGGAAMGGGVELGLYCTYRTISSGVTSFPSGFACAGTAKPQSSSAAPCCQPRCGCASAPSSVTTSRLPLREAAPT